MPLLNRTSEWDWMFFLDSEVFLRERLVQSSRQGEGSSVRMSL